MGDVIFNKNDYKILEALIERKCTAPVASLSISQLKSITGMSLSKIRSVKDKFLLMNFIQEGSKDGNNKTFYTTEEGLKHFKLVFGFTDDDIEDMINGYKELCEDEEE